MAHLFWALHHTSQGDYKWFWPYTPSPFDGSCATTADDTQASANIMNQTPSRGRITTEQKKKSVVMVHMTAFSDRLHKHRVTVEGKLMMIIDK
jgi:hypothetical protein